MKKYKQAHSANAKFGMGDSYGNGIRPKMGRIRELFEPGENPAPPKKLRKPPRTLA